MEAQLRANEFRIFSAVRAELRDAMNRNDRRNAYLAIEELRAMADHSNWPTMRQRCVAALSEYSVH